MFDPPQQEEALIFRLHEKLEKITLLLRFTKREIGSSGFRHLQPQVLAEVVLHCDHLKFHLLHVHLPLFAREI